MSEILLHPHIHATPRAELWCTDADAGTVTQLAGTVERIDQRNSRIQLADARQVERVRQIEIELEVTRQVMAQSDFVALVPERLVRDRPSQLQIAKCPFPLEGFEVSMLWHERNHGHGGRRWIREALLALTASESRR